MKRKLLLVGVVFALVLTLASPVVAQASPREDEHEHEKEAEHESGEKAAQQFNAHGVIVGLSDGDIVPAGKSGWWIVRSRDIYGSLSGDLDGDFALTYKAKVNDAQAGKFKGKLRLHGEDETVSVKGRSEPVEMVVVEGIGYLPRLSISGTWRMSEGLRGKGDFQAWFIFIPVFDEAGGTHIGPVIASSIVMTGKWRPNH